MSNKTIINKDVCDINLETIGNTSQPESIKYLDTGSITKNRIDSTQLLNRTIAPFPSRAQRKVKHQTIIYSTVRPIQEHYGFLVSPDENLIVSTGFLTIDVKDKDIEPKFLYYTITQKSITNYLQTIAANNVSSYPSISPDDLGNLKFRIPIEKIEQQRIAAVLSALDAKIELNNRINAELEAMAKTLYDYWFVQFDFPDKNGKPYKSSSGKMVWNAELKREIPEGWNSVVIDQILAKERTTTKIQASEMLSEGSIPVIDQSTDYIAGYTNDTQSMIKCDVPRIIFGDHTRILKLINFDFARGADGTQVMLSNNKRMPQYLFFHTMLKIDLSNYGYARHYKFLKDQRIILPDETIAQSFNDLAHSYQELIKHNVFENRTLSSLRDWLLPMLMNGQVKVN